MGNTNTREPHAFDRCRIPRRIDLGARGVDSSPAECVNLHGGDDRNRARNSKCEKIKHDRGVIIENDDDGRLKILAAFN